MKRLSLAIFLAVLLIGFSPLPALAKGCGPGPTIFKSRSSTGQSFAVSTNTTFFPTHTIAITSGTSGCSNDGIIFKEKEREFFVAANLDNISREMARGDGQYLLVLSGMMGCKAESYRAFARMTQFQYETLLPGEENSPHGFLTRLEREIESHPLLISACGAQG